MSAYAVKRASRRPVEALPAEAAEDVRLTRWDLRRMRTRKLILHAGRELFADRAYVTPRVEDVARAAGVSRAAFYLHFKSLDELVLAVFEREVRWQLRRYRDLNADVLSSKRRARGWLERFFVSFRAERRYALIVYRALVADPGNTSLIFQAHQRVIDRLARRVPELRLQRPDGGLDMARGMELLFLLRRIEEMSLMAAFDAWQEGFDEALDQTAGDLVRFACRRTKPDRQSQPIIA